MIDVPVLVLSIHSFYPPLASWWILFKTYLGLSIPLKSPFYAHLLDFVTNSPQDTALLKCLTCIKPIH